MMVCFAEAKHAKQPHWIPRTSNLLEASEFCRFTEFQVITIFTLAAHPETQEIVYLSPESGGNCYMWFPQRVRWLCVEDGHDLEGILTRDLLRWVYGVPDLRL